MNSPRRLLRLDALSGPARGRSRPGGGPVDPPGSNPWPARRRAACLAMTMTAVLLMAAGDDAESPTASPDAASDPPAVRLGRVPMPIAQTVDVQVKQSVEKALRELPASESRPVVILEFRAVSPESAAGSQFERALALARFLSSDALAPVRLVAYLPEDVHGHAVLPVLACEEIIVHPDAELGAAGIRETHIDGVMRAGYREIAERRRTVPAIVALGMLDRSLAVYKVDTPDGARYVGADELDDWRGRANVGEANSIIQPGDLGRFTGTDLRIEHSFASHVARDDQQLAAALRVPRASLEAIQRPAAGGEPLRIDVQGPISGKSMNWVIRSTREQLQRESIGFVCVHLDSPGGSPQHSMELASYLASLDETRIRTVAFIPREARADAALIAFGCDEVVMSPVARLGGPGARVIPRRDQESLRVAIRDLAKAQRRDWSLAAGLVDPQLQVARYTHDGTSAVRYLADEEAADLEDRAAWQRGGELDLAEGISGERAAQLGIADHLAGSLSELRTVYHLDKKFDTVRPNWAHQLIASLASPQLAGALMMIAWFAMIIEMAQPGLGVFGFVSALCFGLYFWSQHLNGTAGMLEVLLFTGGVVSILVEVFVVPGFGVFGIGGALLVVSSIILASQTFVVPRNTYQLEQLPQSLMMVVAAGFGAGLSLFAMRKVLPYAPFFRRLVLIPPDEEQRRELSERESLAHYDHLLGKRGLAATRLNPSGKVRIGDEVIHVVSDGELVEPGTGVCVIEVTGNRDVVKSLGA